MDEDTRVRPVIAPSEAARTYEPNLDDDHLSYKLGGEFNPWHGDHSEAGPLYQLPGSSAF